MKLSDDWQFEEEENTEEIERTGQNSGSGGIKTKRWRRGGR
jgi:hypothetical protein